MLCKHLVGNLRYRMIYSESTTVNVWPDLLRNARWETAFVTVGLLKWVSRRSGVNSSLRSE